MARSAASVGKETIKRGLRRLGLKKGDFVGVHGSLSSFGYVAGGAKTVIKALMETVGPEGAIVMPTYSNNRRIVKSTPDEVRRGVTWKYRIFRYYPRRNGCWTGKIPDTFWRMDGVMRGPNPTHSLAAWGKNADLLCQGWDHLLEAGGFILLLGVTTACCSSLHLAEKKVRLPERIRRRNRLPDDLREKYFAPAAVWPAHITCCGRPARRPAKPPQPKWDIGFGPYPSFKLVQGFAEKRGLVRTVTIGKAKVHCFRLAPVIDLYAGLLKKDPDVFYKKGG